jgi:hypothetical protein
VVIEIAGKQGTKLLSGAVEVAEAQKPVQLATTVSEIACIGVWVGPDSGNTGKAIAIGSAKATTEAKPKSEKGVVLYEKAAPIFVEINDLSQIWVDVETSKDKVVWTAVLA